MPVSKAVSREEFNDLRRKVKQIADVLEMSDVIVSFNWKQLQPRDAEILKCLEKHEREGATTTQLAREVGIKKPTTSGRKIVLRRLKRVQEISRRIKGQPIVVTKKRLWFLNWDEFDFQIEEEE